MGFKTCTCCGFGWAAREAFLSDKRVSLLGYQVDFSELKAGFFLFNHDCRTTLALPVALFTDLYEGPVFTERRTGSEECPGYCLRMNELRPCPVHCECAFVREVLQTLKNWPKGRRRKPRRKD